MICFPTVKELLDTHTHEKTEKMKNRERERDRNRSDGFRFTGAAWYTYEFDQQSGQINVKLASLKHVSVS